LANRLDLSHLNLWGHSFGGATVTSYCCKHPESDQNKEEVKAIALDGWMYPIPDHIQSRGIQSASLLNLTSELWPFGKVSEIDPLLA
jgi:pimeloyl-ACP methyl ester carboxylesterase